MMRRSTTRRAPLVSASAANNKVVHNYLTLNRLLGGPKGSAAGHARVFTEVADKCADLKAAALLGRATVFYSRSTPDLALADLQAVLDATKGAGDGLPKALRVSALSYRARCLLQKQALEGQKLSISGAGNPQTLSEIESQISATVAELRSAVPADWASLVLAAEVALARGQNGPVATEDLTKAKAVLDQEKRAVESGVRPTLDCPVARLAFRQFFIKAHEPSAACMDAGTTKAVGGANAALLKPPAHELEAARAYLGAPAAAVSDAALAELACILAPAVESPGHVLDLSPADGTFRRWPKAAGLSSRIDQFRGIAATPGFCGALNAKLNTLQGKKALSDEELAKAKGHKAADGHILDLLKQPSSQLAASDLDFFATIQLVDQEFGAAGNPTITGNASSITAQSRLIVDLLDQASIRASIGLAKAQHQAGNNSGAKAALDAVIHDGRAVDMWKAIELKGHVCRALGETEESDRAFRELHALKHSAAGTDLPLMDTNRVKSAF